ncbi:MAG: IS110 family transposase [Thermoactinomyces vulgaris]|uniref:Transposase n=1 Tax=Thermoactinomyces vulgaris TaxID=2026 RepID=A0ABS0QEY9_THEVU|nr:transposase [Thermoactinomyces vulgaris]MBA4551330.1 transposase [Thermoactinomyces vulgaris]MBA4595460.1 transposase [Thermoactinomyces vulgaris]MBH8587755.1 transposase [Thermoactinomyces vulgaris]MBI0385922.1 transposase [Thermoactinomyces sp. CICC 24227]
MDLNDPKILFQTTRVVWNGANGHYWLNLAYFLKRHQIKVVVVNPFHVHRMKELEENSPTKNDVKDALCHCSANSRGTRADHGSG